jgi:casein kinase II subunit alpha
LIGTGKYSNVYLGADSNTDKKVVIKMLKPVRETKKNREIKILNLVKECPYTVNLIGTMMEPTEGYQALVTAEC